jgi:hypothetical protein
VIKNKSQKDALINLNQLALMLRNHYALEVLSQPKVQMENHQAAPMEKNHFAVIIKHQLVLMAQLQIQNKKERRQVK